MPTNTDTRKYGNVVLEQSKLALDEARKPLFAAVGATDLAYDQLRTQLKELPTETQAQLHKLQKESQVQLKKLQERAQAGAKAFDPTQVSAKLRQTVEDYTAQARETYDSLSHRGELVVRRLRRRPEVRNAFEETERALERAEGLVEQAEEKVTLKSTSSARKPAPRKAPARKTTSTTSTTKA